MQSLAVKPANTFEQPIVPTKNKKKLNREQRTDCVELFSLIPVQSPANVGTQPVADAHVGMHAPVGVGKHNKYSNNVVINDTIST
jgi:CxxC motif-containing protein